MIYYVCTISDNTVGGEHMGLITVDVKDRKLIYEQLIDNIKNLIMEGLIGPEEFLPSVRVLARELGINPNTIQKAYAELERQGVIVSLAGRGSMVTSNITAVRELSKKKISEEMLESVRAAKRAGITLGEYQSLAETLWTTETEEEK